MNAYVSARYLVKVLVLVRRGMKIRGGEASLERTDKILDVRGVVDADTETTSLDESQAPGRALRHAQVDRVSRFSYDDFHFVHGEGERITARSTRGFRRRMSFTRRTDAVASGTSGLRAGSRSSGIPASTRPRNTAPSTRAAKAGSC